PDTRPRHESSPRCRTSTEFLLSGSPAARAETAPLSHTFGRPVEVTSRYPPGDPDRRFPAELYRSPDSRPPNNGVTPVRYPSGPCVLQPGSPGWSLAGSWEHAQGSQNRPAANRASIYCGGKKTGRRQP